MNQLWVNKKQNPSCILFFNGWGIDENAISHLDPGCFDLCMFNNYSSMEPISSDFNNYHTVILIAWSLGVWVAEQLLSRSKIIVDKSIAINGTGSPVHNHYGIPESIFLLTLQKWDETNRNKFNRRMIGGKQNLLNYPYFLSTRTITDQKKELQSIYASIKNKNQHTFHWDMAMIGQNDLIFPAVNQHNWWQGNTKIIVTPQPHFPFISLQRWEQLLMF